MASPCVLHGAIVGTHFLPISLSVNQVPPLMASGGVPERAGMQQQFSDAPDDPDGATPTFIGTVNKHAKFLNDVSKLQVCLPLRFNLDIRRKQNDESQACYSRERVRCVVQANGS